MKGLVASLALAISLAPAAAGVETVGPDEVPDVLVRAQRTVLPKVRGAAEDYARNCQGCHGHLGHSVAEVPRLKDRVGLFTHTPEGRAFLIQVPNVAQAMLSDERLAAMMNWMLEEYSREQLVLGFQPYTAGEVARLRAERLQSVITRRREVIQALVHAGVIADADVLAFSLEPGRY